MCLIVRIAVPNDVNGDIGRTGSNGGFLEIVDVVLVVERQIIVSDSTDEQIIGVVVHTGTDIFPIVTGIVRCSEVNRHRERAGRLDSDDLAIGTGVLIAMRPEKAGRSTRTSESADFLHHILGRRAALGAGEIIVFRERGTVIVNTCRPCDCSGHKARYNHEKCTFHISQSLPVCASALKSSSPSNR